MLLESYRGQSLDSTSIQDLSMSVAALDLIELMHLLPHCLVAKDKYTQVLLIILQMKIKRIIN
jgi:hypothetical protein